MQIAPQDNKFRLESFFRQELPLHLYSLGDLDDVFWANTRWMGLEVNGKLQAVTLLYTAFDPPIYLALSDTKRLHYLSLLLQHTIHGLPSDFYAHLSPGLESLFSANYEMTHCGLHCKMILSERQAIYQQPAIPHRRLVRADLPAIHSLYAVSYPDNAFDPEMLATSQVLGHWHRDELVCIAGMHVYSSQYRVAALGNISTHPNWRGKGLATRLVAALCRLLLKDVDDIGLNVRADNAPALAVYRNLGFTLCAQYHEWSISSRLGCLKSTALKKP